MDVTLGFWRDPRFSFQSEVSICCKSHWIWNKMISPLTIASRSGSENSQLYPELDVGRIATIPGIPWLNLATHSCWQHVKTIQFPSFVGTKTHNLDILGWCSPGLSIPSWLIPALTRAFIQNVENVDVYLSGSASTSLHSSLQKNHDRKKNHGKHSIKHLNVLGLDRLNPFGYGSIPIDTFLVGWTSIYQLFWGSLGTRVLTHPHLNPRFWSTMARCWTILGQISYLPGRRSAVRKTRDPTLSLV